jgi:hypothetical protein
MTRLGSAVVVLLLSACGAWAKVEVVNVQASLGPLGPERVSADYYPHDEVFHRYTVTGLQSDASGGIDVTLESRIFDAAGKDVQTSRDPLKGKLELAGGSFAGTSVVRLDEQFSAGDYTLIVTVKDNLSGEQTQFSRKFTVKPAQFTIISPRFFYGDTEQPAPAGGLVGQLLRVRLKAIGFRGNQGKIDAELAVQVLDEQGKELLPQPKRGTLKSDDVKEVRAATTLNFTEVINLNRPGIFTLRMIVTDKIGKQTTSLDVPLVVRAP